jgi:antitoxin component of RelBE/YafQ-DinJ toxin-antitoxin module
MSLGKTPKNIRFDEVVLEEAKKYQLQTNLNFSELVRLALQNYLKRKLYDVDR